MTNGLYTNMRT